jgi:hypothetical protein
MSVPVSATGYLVMTAIESTTGEADSTTFKIEAVVPGTEPGDSLQRFTGKMMDGYGDTRTYMITIHEAGQILPEVRPYRELVQALIAADTPCPAYNCSVSMLGHLIASLTADQVEMVRALDPDALEEP